MMPVSAHMAGRSRRLRRWRRGSAVQVHMDCCKRCQPAAGRFNSRLQHQHEKGACRGAGISQCGTRKCRRPMVWVWHGCKPIWSAILHALPAEYGAALRRMAVAACHDDSATLRAACGNTNRTCADTVLHSMQAQQGEVGEARRNHSQLL